MSGAKFKVLLQAKLKNVFHDWDKLLFDIPDLEKGCMFNNCFPLRASQHKFPKLTFEQRLKVASCTICQTTQPRIVPHFFEALNHCELPKAFLTETNR